MKLVIGLIVLSCIGSVLDKVGSIFIAVLVISFTIFLCWFVFRKSKPDKVRNRPETSMPSAQPATPVKPAYQSTNNSSPRPKQDDNATISIRIPDSIDGCEIAYKYEDVAFDASGDIYKISNIGRKLDLFCDASDVQVLLDNNRIGTLKNGKLCKMIQDFQHRDEPIYAAFSNFSVSENLGHMHLVFYRDMLRYYMARQPDARAYMLTGNKNAEMQDNLTMCSVGDICDLDYDWEKERYLVRSVIDYGYLPAAATAFVQQHGEEHIAPIVFTVDTDGNGKIAVRVALFIK